MQDQWTGENLFVEIGGDSSGAVAGAGQVWLDDFTVNLVSLTDLPITGDLDVDGDINIDDLSVIAAWWLRDNCDSENDYCDGADFAPTDGRVNLLDFARFSLQW